MLEVVQVSNTKSSLVLGETFEGGLNVLGVHQAQVLELLETTFAATGATNAELETAFIAAGYGKEASFSRALRALKMGQRLQQRKVDGRNRYFCSRVGVKAVSSECQIPTRGGVMSSPSLGDDTDTKSEGAA